MAADEEIQSVRVKALESPGRPTCTNNCAEARSKPHQTHISPFSTSPSPSARSPPPCRSPMYVSPFFMLQNLLLQFFRLQFENVLKEVVNGKRLSASKMTNLTDIAMKNMEVHSATQITYSLICWSSPSRMTQNSFLSCIVLTRACPTLPPKYTASTSSMLFHGQLSIMQPNTIFQAMHSLIQEMRLLSCWRWAALWKDYSKTWWQWERPNLRLVPFIRLRAYLLPWYSQAR